MDRDWLIEEHCVLLSQNIYTNTVKAKTTNLFYIYF